MKENRDLPGTRSGERYTAHMCHLFWTAQRACLLDSKVVRGKTVRWYRTVPVQHLHPLPNNTLEGAPAEKDWHPGHCPWLAASPHGNQVTSPPSAFKTLMIRIGTPPTTGWCEEAKQMCLTLNISILIHYTINSINTIMHKIELLFFTI